MLELKPLRRNQLGGIVNMPLIAKGMEPQETGRYRSWCSWYYIGIVQWIGYSENCRVGNMMTGYRAVLGQQN